jgi:uncharacterized membrane protein
MITLFLPISVAGGYAIYILRKVYSNLGSPVAKTAGDIMLIALGLISVFLGARSILTIINPVTTYFKMADRTAARWIEENLNPESKILINPAPWGYGMYVGSDGGYWLSPLTGVTTFPPTLLYAHGPAESYASVNRQSREVLASAQDPVKLVRIMEELDLDYLYLGAQGGPISPKMILQSPLFELIFHQEGVWIFRQDGTVRND